MVMGKWFDIKDNYMFACYGCIKNTRCYYIDGRINDGNCLGIKPSDILPTQDNLKKQKKGSNGGR